MLSSVHDFLETPLGLWLRVVAYLFLSCYLIRSGVWPNTKEPKKWYDRTIRVAGGVLFLGFSAFGSARIMGWVK